VDVHVDVLCPFAYLTSRWLREVSAATGLVLNWRFFSLEEVNLAEGKKHPWERPWSYGWSLMRIGVVLRRRDMTLLDAWYAACGRLLHVEGRKPHQPEVARALLGELGLDGGILDEALADETTHDEIREDHERVLRAGGFGVPTLFFPDGQCLFGPVLIDPPRGGQAVALWEAVTAWTAFPQLYELQRPKSAADRAAIGRALAPYLSARDWVSIDRGKVVDVAAFTGTAAPPDPSGADSPEPAG
jgi:2-hydroxychromene-2-carboxylate isomerase